MLESLVAWVLNTYIGEYLENLNTDQLSVAVLQGQVELESVPLKKSALRKFDIPVSVKAALRTEAWKVGISDLYVLLEPSDNKYDVEFDEEYQKNKKLQQLEALEAFHKKQILEALGLPQTDEVPSSSWLTYGASLVSAIVENIQLTVNNVHIRYEDDRTLGGSAFACGIKINRMAVQSTNSKWKTGFIERRDRENLFKLLDLSGVSVYWDSGVKMSDTPESLREIIALLGAGDSHGYVLSPVTAQVRMERNTSKFPLKTRPPIPRFKFDLEPESLQLEMSKRQLLEMRLLTREWARYERARKNRKWRPKESISDSPGKWWNFAINCQLEWIRKRRERESWKYALTRAKTVIAYGAAYRRRLESLAEKGKDEGGDNALIKQVERDPEYTYEDLHILRDTVFRKLLAGYKAKSEEEGESEEDFATLGSSETYETPDEDISSHSLNSPRDPAPQPQQQGGGLYGWISSWFSGSGGSSETATEEEASSGTGSQDGAVGWWSSASSASQLPQYLRDAEKQLEEGILDVLNESWDDSTLLRRDTLLARVQLCIRSLTLSFLDDNAGGSPTNSGGSCTKVLAGQLSEVFAGIELSPRHHTTSLDLSVGDLSVHSELLKSAPSESLLWGSGMTAVFALGKSVTPLPLQLGPSKPLLRCYYERKVAKFVARHTISLDFSPISIMYQASALEMLTEFFEGTVPPERGGESRGEGGEGKEKEGGVVTTPDIYLTQVSAHVKVPSLSIELRSELSIDPGGMASPDSGRAFACAHFHALSLQAKKTEPWRVDMEVNVGGVELEDLVEGERNPGLKYLLKTVPSSLGKASEFLSNSCPELTRLSETEQGDGDGFELIAGSLPKASTLSPVSASPTAASVSHTPKISRRGSLERLNSDGFSRSNGACCFQLSLIDHRHPKFLSLYKGKTCRISGSFDSLEISVNPQTWVLFFDFLGIIGPPPAPLSKKEMLEPQPLATDRKEVVIKARRLRLVMNQPTQMSELGTLSLNESQIAVEVSSTGLQIDGDVLGLVLEDGDPIYSKLYPTKISVPRTLSSSLKVFKYSKPDPDLLRPYDLIVEVKLPTAFYVHTQRFFSALLNYWLHLIDLIDYLSQVKAALAGQQAPTLAGPGHGTRVMLKVDVLESATLLLPVNSLSKELLVAEMTNLRIGNNFLFASQTFVGAEANLKASATGFEDDNHDCLLDVMHVDCDDLDIFSGLAVPEDSSIPTLEGHVVLTPSAGLCLMKETTSILAKPYHLSVVVQRNLDASISKNVPDLAIFVHIVEERFRVTVDVYKRVRGLLEHNLGEELPPPPKAPAFKTNPSNVTVLTGKVWSGLSFQLEMTKVELDCLWPDGKGGWSPLGEVDFSFAQLSFETLSDQSSELDLILRDAALLDTRFEGIDLPASKRPNVFPRILSRRKMNDPKIEGGLMGEVHFMSGKNMEPKLTVLLSQIQLMGIFDWIMKAKDFLVSAVELQKPKAAKSMQVATIANPFSPGVVQKIPIPLQGLEGMTLKVNLLDCSMVLFEDSANKSSLGFLVQVSGVLYLSDRGGVPSIRLEARSVQLSTCLPCRIETSQSQLTEPFSGNVEIVQEKLSNALQKSQPGLGEMVPPERRLEVSVSDMVARLSYRDFLICEAVVKALLASSGEPDPEGGSEAGPDIANKILMKISSLAVWLLDDYEDTLFPLVRFGLRRGEFEQQLTSLDPDGVGRMEIFVDYFNQKVYGWEPLLEPFFLEKVAWCSKPKQPSLQLAIYSQSSVLDFTLTQSFLEQTMQFMKRWPDVKKKLGADFRVGLGKHRTDHLPYLLKNETGSPLKFTTYLNTDGGGKKAKWLEAEVGQSVPFAFPNRHYSVRNLNESYSPHQIIIMVDGFQEISPVSVDSVGTYFRSAKYPIEASSSSLSYQASFVRVVVAVTTDQDGRKLISVRSSLSLVNGLFDAIQVKLENMTTYVNDVKELTINPGEVVHAPLHYAFSKIHARPTAERWSLKYCSPISWEGVKRKGESRDEIKTCVPTEDDSQLLHYRMCIRILREHYPETEITAHGQLPGHTVTFYPPLTLLNLLPVELGLQLDRVHARIPSGNRTAFTAVDALGGLSLGLEIENFQMLHPLRITPTSEETVTELAFVDERDRMLIVEVSTVIGRGRAVQLAVSVPYWIVNKSSLAVVVKQEACVEAAGQFDEHERARNMLPLMFSFSNRDAPSNLSIRLGLMALATPQPKGLTWEPKWAPKFPLEGGITDRKLSSKSSQGTKRTFNVGVEVRAGQGLYKRTKIVILTTLTELLNRSRHHLCVTQLHDTKDGHHTLSVAPNCSVAWHWPRPDMADMQFLAVKRADLPHWSSGFPSNKLSSFHLNIRNKELVPTFLRVETVLHGGMYYVTLSDADTLPPPIRIENNSEIQILYYQSGAQHLSNLSAVLHPGQSVNYNWDDLLIPKPERRLVLVVFNGREAVYDLELGGKEPLIYDNNFFIQLRTTHVGDMSNRKENERNLVLEARLKDGLVVLGAKERHNQRQLWRMTAGGRLVNVGICEELRKLGRKKGQDDPVLDTRSDPDGSLVQLIIAEPNEARWQTQKWTFTEDSRLMCEHKNLFVQASHPTSMSANTPVFLGPTVATGNPGVPPEQWVEREREKPGSGQLGITVTQQGPTRVLEITDLGNEKRRGKRRQKDVARKRSAADGVDLEFSLMLHQGIGVSLVNSALEELIYCRLIAVQLTCDRKKATYTLKGYIYDVQADNQLWNCERWAMLYIKKQQENDELGNLLDSHIPCIRIEMQWTPFPNYDSFECFQVAVNKVSLQLEEVLLWKLLEYLTLGGAGSRIWPSSSVPSTPATPATAGTRSIAGGRKFIPLEEPDLELVRPDRSQTRRCYFGSFLIELPRLYLSVLTVPKSMLPQNLRLLKEQWNVALVRFESAPVSLASFQQQNVFESLSFLWDALQKHYAKALRAGAIKILGTVDFLGNPIGLWQDFESGLKELVIEGNVSGFVGGIGHGLSNTVAKISSSVSEGLGHFDSSHSRTRDFIRQNQYHEQRSAVSHVFSGVKGLGLGIMGGATSLITQPIEGLKKEGTKGLGVGIAKGLVNTVTRPVQGVLDLTTGVATGVKEGLSSNVPAHVSRFPSSRVRCPRATHSLNGTIPPYSADLSEAQKLLIDISERSTNEICLNVHLLLTDEGSYALRALVCTERVYFVKSTSEEAAIHLERDYARIECCSSAVELLKGIKVPILKLQLKPARGRVDDGKIPADRIRCNSMEIAEKMCRNILFAKQLHDELKRRIPIPEDFNPDPVPTYAQSSS